MKLNRGDIVIANLESVSKGSIQKYTRPVSYTHLDNSST